jgi:hypothetical protein
VATPIDVEGLIKAITQAASKEVGQDVTALGGFSQRQLEAMARQAQLVAAAFASGHLSADDRTFFLGQLKDDAQNFANVLQGLVLADIQRVWNAAVSTVWDAIGKAVGITLPLA